VGPMSIGIRTQDRPARSSAAVPTTPLWVLLLAEMFVPVTRTTSRDTRLYASINQPNTTDIVPLFIYIYTYIMYTPYIFIVYYLFVPKIHIYIYIY
jgi:hypothetical protein